MDYFDHIPDPLILQILSSISDVKTLVRCRAVSRRFHLLVPERESLVLSVNGVVTESDRDSLPFLPFLKTLLKSFLSTFLSPSDKAPIDPARALRGFERIRELNIELPAGDLSLEKGTVVRYKAAFGATLKSCVILVFGDKSRGAFTEGLRDRMLWSVSVLIAASVRHAYVASEVVGQCRDLVRLAVRDRDGEGEVMMDERGLAECREAFAWSESGSGRCRTAKLRVRMKMMHLETVEIGTGVCLEGANLVIVRPCGPHRAYAAAANDRDDADLAMEAFGGGVYGNAVQELLKSKSYSLVIN